VPWSFPPGEIITEAEAAASAAVFAASINRAHLRNPRGTRDLRLMSPIVKIE
jgi:hypothetical protein